MNKLRLAILVSGSGTTLQAIIDAIRKKELRDAEIAVVVSNKPDITALERAKKAEIETLVMNPKDFPERSLWCSAMAKEVKKRHVDLVCLAGFLQKLEPCFVRSFPGQIINTHPALLPKFGGAGMYGLHVHEAVLKAGETETGCTLHAVDEEYDHGAILAQVKVPVRPGDTPQTLAERVQAEERKLYPQVIQQIAEGKIKLEKTPV